MIPAVRRALTIGGALAIFGACIEFGGPNDGVISISNLRIPYPSVVAGDVLRDSLGEPSPLAIIAYDGDGQPLPTEPVTFIALDTSIAVDADGTVHGLVRDTLGGRVVGGAGTLQTPAQRIIVTIAPTLATKSSAATAIAFDASLPDSTSKLNWSPALSLTLTGAGSTPAHGFVVSYSLIHTPPPKEDGVATAYIADETNRRQSRDTTDTRGEASRRVILRQAAVSDALRAGQTTDSIVVRATVRYKGLDVPGSPIEFTVPVSRKP